MSSVSLLFHVEYQLAQSIQFGSNFGEDGRPQLFPLHCELDLFLDLFDCFAHFVPSVQNEFHLLDHGLQVFGLDFGDVATSLQLLDGDYIDIDQVLKFIDCFFAVEVVLALGRGPVGRCSKGNEPQC